jgi:hypothetical protein
MAWDPLTGVDLDADVIVTEGTMNALYTNPTAMAKRESGTPAFVQVPVREYKTSGTAATWTIPDGVTAWNEIIIGGGAAVTGGSSTQSGGASSTTYNSVTVTASGGSYLGAGGSGTNGDINFTGQNDVIGGDTPLGYGHCPRTLVSADGRGYGAGASSSLGYASASGGIAIKRRVLVPGQTTVTYTVGAGGVASSSGTGGGGLIIFEY